MTCRGWLPGRFALTPAGGVVAERAGSRGSDSYAADAMTYTLRLDDEF